MIKEAYCSFKVAKLLKEKGFDIPCYGRYSVRSQELHLDTTRPCNNGGISQYSAPTHQVAIAWLRTKHIIIVIQPKYFSVDGTCHSWEVDIWADDNYEKLQGDYPEYEEAIEASLKYVLENLI